MPDIELAAESGSVSGYLAAPACGEGPAAVVLQDWWTIDRHAPSVCDRLAAEGFFALAPEFHLDGPTADHSTPLPGTLALSIQTAARDMRAVVGCLLSTPGVRGPSLGIIGFGFGGGLAMLAAAASPEVTAAVIYYALRPEDDPDFAQIHGPVLGHFGTADIFVSLKDAKALEMHIRSAGVDVEFEKYTAAGHGFFNENGQSGTYDASAAERSWERTMGFLRAALSPSEATPRPDTFQRSVRR